MSVDHDHDRAPAHPRRPDVEDLPADKLERLEAAVPEPPIEKGGLGQPPPGEILGAIGPWTPGPRARPGARAWGDAGYGARLPASAPAPAARELGVATGATDPVTMEDTAGRHNPVVGSPCSCYPGRIPGIPPGWYGS